MIRRLVIKLHLRVVGRTGELILRDLGTNYAAHHLVATIHNVDTSLLLSRAHQHVTLVGRVVILDDILAARVVENVVVATIAGALGTIAEECIVERRTAVGVAGDDPELLVCILRIVYGILDKVFGLLGAVAVTAELSCALGLDLLTLAASLA